jgi:hypothetical protein
MGSPADAPLLKDVPIWVFNGADDPGTTAEEAGIMVDALAARVASRALPSCPASLTATRRKRLIAIRACSSGCSNNPAKQNNGNWQLNLPILHNERYPVVRKGTTMQNKVFSIGLVAATVGSCRLWCECRDLLRVAYRQRRKPGTSIKAPLRTIQKAVNVAKPGDTILVRGGTYRETVSTSRSGTSTARITIRNYQNEVVTVSGLNPIVGNWTAVGNEVYRAPMPWNYHFENESRDYNSNQVFHNRQMMELVRWPNQTSRDLVRPTLAIADSVTFSKSDPALPSNDLATFQEADFTDNPARWVGAKIWVNLSRNGTDGQGQRHRVSARRAVTVKALIRAAARAPGASVRAPSSTCSTDARSLENSGGIRGGADRGEWFSTSGQQIYVRTLREAGRSGVEPKRRTYGFNLDGDSYLTCAA